MRSGAAIADYRRSYWLHVREFAVPPSMIESATARRRVGDWAGACAAARIDVDLDLPSVSRGYGQELAGWIRADLRHLAPDLLRWHMPRIAPDGLLRPGVTISLARYAAAEHDGDSAVQLVVRTPPRWADAGQRISLALWEGSRSRATACRYPHPHPDRRFRLDLHRHLWDVRRAPELRVRSGADQPPGGGPAATETDPLRTALRARGGDVNRWAAEAGILLRAQGRTGGMVAVRCGARHRLILETTAGGGGGGPPTARIRPAAADARRWVLPMLPDAATWLLPDLELLRNGLIEADRLHPLVASALVPDRPPAGGRPDPHQAARPRLVECRGARHRIGIIDGVLVPLDHDPAEVRREELLAALTGTPLTCLQVVDQAHRRPERLMDIHARLVHGDVAGALAAVDDPVGPEALVRGGALREELETAAHRRIAYGLFRAGLAGVGPDHSCPPERRRARDHRSHPRHATTR